MTSVHFFINCTNFSIFLDFLDRFCGWWSGSVTDFFLTSNYSLDVSANRDTHKSIYGVHMCGIWGTWRICRPCIAGSIAWCSGWTVGLAVNTACCYTVTLLAVVVYLLCALWHCSPWTVSPFSCIRGVCLCARRSWACGMSQSHRRGMTWISTNRRQQQLVLKHVGKGENLSDRKGWQSESGDASSSKRRLCHANSSLASGCQVSTFLTLQLCLLFQGFFISETSQLIEHQCCALDGILSINGRCDWPAPALTPLLLFVANIDVWPASPEPVCFVQYQYLHRLVAVSVLLPCFAYPAFVSCSQLLLRLSLTDTLPLNEPLPATRQSLLQTCILPNKSIIKTSGQ